MSLVTRLLPVLLLSAAATAAHAGSGLSDEDVRRVVRANGHEVRACYEKHAMRQKEATGKVLLDLVVGSEGKVEQIHVDAEGVRGKRFQRCVEGRVRAWQFPEASEPTEVQYPFHFQHTRT